jgi:hypothetical protein
MIPPRERIYLTDCVLITVPQRSGIGGEDIDYVHKVVKSHHFVVRVDFSGFRPLFHNENDSQCAIILRSEIM